MYKYPCSELHLNSPPHFHSGQNLCMRAFFHVYKAIWERSGFFPPTSTALSLNPLISGCEILPSISSILNDFLTPLAILFTFLDFLSSPLNQGVHLEGKNRDFTWHSSHYDHDVTSRLAQAVLQMQKTSAILVAGFLILSQFQDHDMVYSAIVFFHVYSTRTNHYLIVFLLAQQQQCNRVYT